MWGGLLLQSVFLIAILSLISILRLLSNPQEIDYLPVVQRGPEKAESRGKSM